VAHAQDPSKEDRVVEDPSKPGELKHLSTLGQKSTERPAVAASDPGSGPSRPPPPGRSALQQATAQGHSASPVGWGGLVSIEYSAGCEAVEEDRGPVLLA